MTKSQRDRGDSDEDQEADKGAAKPGWRLRLKAALSSRLAQRLDRAVALLQRQREKLAPVEVEGEDGKTSTRSAKLEVPKSAVKLEVKPKAKRKPAVAFLLGIVALLVGTIAGAVFSFSLFAQKIESQGDFIANLADEVFESNKDALHAERVLEKSKAELKETQQQLKETEADLQKTKTRLVGVEGRAIMYGNKGNAADPVTANRESQAAVIRSLARQQQSRESNCDLGSATASRDLSRCLDGR
jgi:hypothetical protein